MPHSPAPSQLEQPSVSPVSTVATQPLSDSDYEVEQAQVVPHTPIPWMSNTAASNAVPNVVLASSWQPHFLRRVTNLLDGASNRDVSAAATASLPGIRRSVTAP